MSSRGIAAPMLALACAAIGSLLPAWTRLPIALYDPLARSWRFDRMGTAPAGKIEMTYYGIYLCAAVAGIVGAGLGLALERARGGGAGHGVEAAGSFGLLPLWALCALALAAAYQAFALLA